MSARAVWKGVVRLGTVSVPVKLYSAVQEKTVHFRLLHAKDKTPVRMEMVRADTGEVAASGEVCRGYPVEDRRMVILTDEELKRLEPEPSRDIEVICFLSRTAVDHRWYERPYYLGPDGDGDRYSALAAALAGTGMEGLVRWVMRNREYYGVLGLQEGYPVLITIRHTEEVVPVSDLTIPAGREMDRRELAMAGQLVSAMTGAFDPGQYRDTYRERVMELIRAKAAGKVVRLKKGTPKKEAGELSRALEESLRAVGDRRRG